MSQLPILYSFRRCPYAMRARLAVAISGQQVELREVVLRDKPEEMLEVSPKGTVPVLVLQDRRVIEESLDVMKWALQQNDPEAWLPSITPEHEAWINENDSTFKKALDHYKYAQRHTEPAHVYRAQGEEFLQKLENRLGESAFLAGDQRGFVDAAIFPFVRQFAHVDKDWFYAANYPHLQRWLDGWLASDLFAQIMHKYAQWTAGSDPVLFP